MPSIGDIANDVARTLYEFRIPVAILSIAGAIAFVAIAHRLGWIAAARRHPRRAAALAIAFVAVTGPLAWYLGSPLFIRTTLVEPQVVAAAPSPTADPAGSPPPSDAPPAFAPRVVTSGEFTGTDEFHFGSGTASIVEVEPGRYRIQLDDFSVRNGPDLYVVLSPDPDGYTPESLEVGLLKATDGSFGYDLPEGTDPADFASALIWCKQFSHLFAYATFGA